MERFHIIDDAAAILVSKGVFKQAKVYRRGNSLFAGHAGGFIRLYKDGGASLPNVRHDGLDVGGEITGHDALGRLSLAAPQ